MTFPSGKAYCKTSYEESFNNYLIIKTKEGEFGLAPAFAYNDLKGTTSEEKMRFKNVNQQALQMDTFAQNII